MQRQDNRWLLRAKESIPREGIHAKGWQKVIKTSAGINWSQLAQDRDNWRSMGEIIGDLWGVILALQWA